jgi:hypothetical protein
LHKEKHLDICKRLLDCCGAEGDYFLERIVTGDETWTHHYEPESKQALRGRRLTADQQLDVTVSAWLVSQPKTFYSEGIKQIVR